MIDFIDNLDGYQLAALGVAGWMFALLGVFLMERFGQWLYEKMRGL